MRCRWLLAGELLRLWLNATWPLCLLHLSTYVSWLLYAAGRQCMVTHRLLVMWRGGPRATAAALVCHQCEMERWDWCGTWMLGVLSRSDLRSVHISHWYRTVLVGYCVSPCQQVSYVAVLDMHAGPHPAAAAVCRCWLMCVCIYVSCTQPLTLCLVYRTVHSSPDFFLHLLLRETYSCCFIIMCVEFALKLILVTVYKCICLIQASSWDCSIQIY